MLSTLEKPITDIDFEALPQGPPYYQLIAGELIITPSPTPEHQTISSNLNQALRDFVSRNKLGRVLYAPIDVRLTKNDVYQPDLIFIRSEKLSRVTREKLNVIPNLVVEVLSPSNAYYDLTHKKTVYAESGVEEYWVVDPNDETIELFVNENGRFQTKEFFKIGDTLQSPLLPGFSMKVEEVFAF